MKDGSDMRTDTIAPADSLLLTGVLMEQPDTATATAGGERFGLVIAEPPRGRDGLQRPDTPAGASWVAAILLLVFALIGIRFRANYKFLRGIIADLTDRGGRHSIFEDTVRETFYMLALNLLWAVSCGVLLYTGISATGQGYAGTPAGLGAAIGGMLLYGLAEVPVYRLCGIVFSNSRLTHIWLRGQRAAQALAALGLFPLALAAMSVPEWSGVCLWLAASVYAIVRIVYIRQGFSIFFNHPGGIVPFFYYLCGLEIAPLLLLYRTLSGLVRIMN